MLASITVLRGLIHITVYFHYYKWYSELSILHSGLETILYKERGGGIYYTVKIANIFYSVQARNLQDLHDEIIYSFTDFIL